MEGQSRSQREVSLSIPFINPQEIDGCSWKVSVIHLCKCCTQGQIPTSHPCQCETESRPSPQKLITAAFSKILSCFTWFFRAKLTLSAIYSIAPLKSTSPQRNICIMVKSAPCTLKKLNIFFSFLFQLRWQKLSLQLQQLYSLHFVFLHPVEGVPAHGRQGTGTRCLWSSFQAKLF